MIFAPDLSKRILPRVIKMYVYYIMLRGSSDIQPRVCHKHDKRHTAIQRRRCSCVYIYERAHESIFLLTTSIKRASKRRTRARAELNTISSLASRLMHSATSSFPTASPSGPQLVMLLSFAAPPSTTSHFIQFSSSTISPTSGGRFERADDGAL